MPEYTYFTARKDIRAGRLKTELIAAGLPVVGVVFIGDFDQTDNLRLDSTRPLSLDERRAASGVIDAHSAARESDDERADRERREAQRPERLAARLADLERRVTALEAGSPRRKCRRRTLVSESRGSSETV